MQWVQNPNQRSVGNLNNVRREVSRHFRNKKKEYLKAKIEELKTNCENKIIADLYGGINEFKKGYRPRTNIHNISIRSLTRILHADLKLHPYKMMMAQELSERDHVNRRTISAEILEQVPAAAVLSSDEAHFYTSGAVNKQNFRYWAERNLRDF